MSDLRDVLHYLMERFGRPREIEAPIGHNDEVDGRLDDLEKRQREIAARLRILEKAGNPRGIGRDF